MNSKKILSAVLSFLLVILTFSACGSNKPADNKKETNSPPEEITLSGEVAEDVTAITASTDTNGKVIDSKGIIDAEGHKIYDTGKKNANGKTIYTTGKKDINGNILYTLNTTDDKGNLLYYTGTEKDGKLELKPTQYIPDYTSNENSSHTSKERYTTTSTVKYEKPEGEKTYNGFTKEFISYAGSAGYDQFRKVVASKNGGFITAGIAEKNDGIFTKASKSWSTFATVAKYDDKGKLLWTYVSGGDGDVQFNDVIELKDGSIIAAGYTCATDTDAPLTSSAVSSLIVKLSKDGNVIWSYVFPGDENSDGDYITCLAATPDGGFVAGGRSDSTSGFFSETNKDYHKAFLFKFNKNADIQWRKILSGSKGNTISAVSVNDSGDIFASCVTYSVDGSFTSLKGYGKLTSNTVILKLDKKGGILWTSNLVGSGSSEYNTLCATSDGGVIAGGKMAINKRADGSYSMCYGKQDGYVVRFDKNGGVCWGRNVGGSLNDEVTGILETENGIIVVGKTLSSDCDFTSLGKSKGKTDSFIMILDSAGKTSYAESFSGSEDDAVLDVKKTEKGFVISGWTSSATDSFNNSKANKTPDAFVASFILKNVEE